MVAACSKTTAYTTTNTTKELYQKLQGELYRDTVLGGGVFLSMYFKKYLR